MAKNITSTSEEEELDPTATDETADVSSDDSGEGTPYADPLASMFGQQEEAAEDDDDDADETETDEESSADVESDADDSDDSSDGEAGEDEGAEDAEDASESDDDEENSDETNKWKAQLAKLPPEAQKIVKGQRHAIEKLRKQRNRLKDEKAAAITERDQLKQTTDALKDTPAKFVPTETNPLSDLTSEADVRVIMETAEQTLEWCEDNEDGAEIKDAQGNVTRELTKAEVRTIKRNAEAMLNKHGPKRIEWLTKFAAAQKQAKTAYPKLFEAGEVRTQAEALLKEYPELAGNANHSVAIGDLLVGRLVREGKLVTIKAGKKAPETTAAKAKAKTPTNLSSTASGSAPAAKPKKVEANRSTEALRKDLHEGKGDPLAFMLSAGRGTT